MGRARSAWKVTNDPASVAIWSVIAIAVTAALLGLLWFDKGLYVELAREGANSELATALFYFIAGILVAIVAVRRLVAEKSISTVVFYFLLAAFLVVVAGEEESWGQWQLQFDVPAEVKEANYQGEFNLHNLTAFDALGGRSAQYTVLNLIALFAGVIAPVAYAALRRVRRLLDRLHCPVAPLSCTAFFAIGILYPRMAAVLHTHWANAEIREFLFSCGFLLYGVAVYQMNRLPGGIAGTKQVVE